MKNKSPFIRDPRTNNSPEPQEQSPFTFNELQVLKKQGWEIESLRPLSIRNSTDGYATGEAALLAIEKICDNAVKFWLEIMIKSAPKGSSESDISKRVLMTEAQYLNFILNGRLESEVRDKIVNDIASSISCNW